MEDREWNEDEIYTAWDLCGDWGWAEHFHAKTVNGRVLYMEATASAGYQGVRLNRIEGTSDILSVKLYTRYVKPETPMKLVRVK